MAWRVSTSVTGRMLLLHDDLPGFGDFVGIAGTQHEHVRHGAQRRQLLDRLMRRAVFADADRVVREDEDRPESPSTPRGECVGRM